MKQGDGPEQQLNLLLENYEKSSQRRREVDRLGTSVFLQRTQSGSRRQGWCGAGDFNLSISLSLDDYPSRASRWLAQVSPAKGIRETAPELRPFSGSTPPTLRLFLENYALGALFLFQIQENVGKTFGSDGFPESRTREEKSLGTQKSSVRQVFTKGVAETGLNRKNQVYARERRSETEV